MYSYNLLLKREIPAIGASRRSEDAEYFPLRNMPSLARTSSRKFQKTRAEKKPKDLREGA